jgi:hypothetical protein
MIPSKLPRLTSSAFERAENLTGLGPETIEIARRVLVHGHIQNVVANETGITRQGVHAAVKKFLERYKGLNAYAKKAAAKGFSAKPPGFVTVTLTAPVELAEQWRKIAAVALAEARRKAPPAAAKKPKKQGEPAARKRPAKTAARRS